MEYKVVPFVASINPKKENSSQVAQQLEETIKHYSHQGWKYISLESVSTYVQSSGGCFGFGSTPGFTTNRQMIVFSKL